LGEGGYFPSPYFLLEIKEKIKMAGKMFNVKNRSSSMVVYRIPEDGVRRQFAPGESKRLSYAELEKLTYQPGGRALLTNFLQITEDEATEGLGVYRGGFTYTNLYCRPSENSTMRNQFAENGQYFNAISRWAIWYRVMKLTGGTSASQFKDSFAQFIEFDKTLTITKSGVQTKGLEVSESTFVPTAPPVLVQGHWENGRFITE
jgi:hypothetical protein